MRVLFFILLTTLGVWAQGPVAPPTTIFGTVRNLAGEIIDNPEFELIAVFADGVEVGRVPLDWNATSSENYRFEIPNVSVVSTAAFTVKLIRDGTAVSIFDATLAFAAFQPIQGQLARFDFTEIVDGNNDGTPGDGPPNPVAPPTTIFGTVRDLAGEIIDNPGFEKIAVYADGVEIGRVPLTWNATASENYRFEIPNFSEVSTASYSVKLLRDGQAVSIIEPGMTLLSFQPVQGELVRFDFVEIVASDEEEPVAPSTTIYGTVRNLAGMIIDVTSFEKIVIYADGVEIGRVLLRLVAENTENYRFDIPNFSEASPASYSVKLLRAGQLVSIIEPGMPLLAFQPIQGQPVRVDFVEIVAGDDEVELVDPSTTIYGTVRNLAREIIDITSVEKIVIYEDGAEIGRVLLRPVEESTENYRFDIPNFSEAGTVSYSVKLLRAGQLLSLIEPGMPSLSFQPIQGQLVRLDFVEIIDVDNDGLPDVEPVAPPTTIFGTVRNLAGEIIDNPSFEKIAIYVDGVELGQVPLESIPEGNENYRFDIPNLNVLSQASYSVKLIRDGQQISIIDPGMTLLPFQPIQGQLVRLDFVEIVDTDNDGMPDRDAEPPVAPPTTVFGTVRNLAGDLIDNPIYEEIVFYADGVEIGRVPLESVVGENENYRFDLPNLSVLSEATYSVKLIRDSQLVSIFEPDFELFLYQPIQGALKRFDFVEKPDVDLDGILDELEIVDLSPDGDYDNDGLTDLQELAIGTDPTDWKSGVNFKIIRELPNGDLEVAFDVVSGFTYRLQVTTDLSDWTQVSSLTATSDTRRTILTAPVSGDSVFWRICVR